MRKREERKVKKKYKRKDYKIEYRRTRKRRWNER